MTAYMPLPTATTRYFEPKDELTYNQMLQEMQLGDMIFNKNLFKASGGIWQTLGLADETDKDSLCLFNNLSMSLPQITLGNWGRKRLNYLQEHNPTLANSLGFMGLPQHCKEIETQAEAMYTQLMAQARADKRNQLTEQDKVTNPMAWAARMSNHKHRIHEQIYTDLIYS